MLDVFPADPSVKRVARVQSGLIKTWMTLCRSADQINYLILNNSALIHSLIHLQVCWWPSTSHRSEASVTWTTSTWMGPPCAASPSSISYSPSRWTWCTWCMWWCSSVGINSLRPANTSVVCTPVLLTEVLWVKQLLWRRRSLWGRLSLVKIKAGSPDLQFSTWIFPPKSNNFRRVLKKKKKT